MTVRILQGDCREVLKTLDAESVHCVVTSPPYFGLRDYGIGADGGELGQESTPLEFVDALVGVFREVRRVLRKDGVAWMNLGDSYAGSWGAQGRHGAMASRSVVSARQIAAHPHNRSNTGSIRQAGLKPKDLIGIPWRVAFALQADGWWLRQDIVWQKLAPMPESVRDRCTRSHEYIFTLTKSERYYWDSAAIAEPAVSDHPSGNGYNRPERTTYQNADGSARGADEGWDGIGGTRNKRSVWTVGSQPFKEAHFATMPPALVEPMILAGSSEKGCCSRCGAPWTRMVESAKRKASGSGRSGNQAAGKGHEQVREGHDPRDGFVVSTKTIGWEPSCACVGAVVIPCTVLDPFSGAGTTALVADRLGRNAIGIELNQEYIDMSLRRIEADGPLFADVAAG